MATTTKEATTATQVKSPADEEKAAVVTATATRKSPEPAAKKVAAPATTLPVVPAEASLALVEPVAVKEAGLPVENSVPTPIEASAGVVAEALPAVPPQAEAVEPITKPVAKKVATKKAAAKPASVKADIPPVAQVESVAKLAEQPAVQKTAPAEIEAPSWPETAAPAVVPSLAATPKPRKKLNPLGLWPFPTGTRP